MPHKVLLVDDEPNITQALKNTLHKEKYEILCANSAQAAFDTLARQPIDVIVADEQMPGMPGSMMMAQIRCRYPDTVRILLTGHASPQAAARAINEGEIYRFLQKPCNGLDLVLTLRRALQHKALMVKCRQLLVVTRAQTTLLDELKAKHPGIAQSAKNVWKAILGEETPHNLDSLLQIMDTELQRVKKLLDEPDKNVCPASAITPEPSSPSQPPPHQSVQPQTSPPTVGGQERVETQPALKPAASATLPETNQNQLSDEALGSETGGSALEEVKNLKELKPLMTRSEIQEYLDSCRELKALSPTVAQVLKMTQSAQCSIDQVVKVVKQDHAISLKILKLANSSAYTRGEPLDTVQKAIMRIGLAQMRQAVLNISVIDQFGGGKHQEMISVPQFWEHSIATGLIAAEITRSLGGKDAEMDSAFTLGLLHDVGRMVYLELLGDKYIQVVQTSRKLEVPLEYVESRMLLINHADAMDRILRKWKFGTELINPIALHQLSLGNIRRFVPNAITQVAILALANRLAHALLLGTSGNVALYPTEEFCSTLKLKAELIAQIAEEIPGQTDDVKFAMLACSHQDNWPRLGDELQKQLQVPFRPLHVSAEPDFDALRIFCRRLQTPVEEVQPNVGIIHIQRGQERSPLTSKLVAAEAEANVGPLPLIILSPKGDIQLEESAQAGRRIELLPFPVSIMRFISVFNSLTTSTGIAAIS